MKAARDPHGEWLVTGPPSAQQTIVLAHGAGQGMDSPFMNHIAEGLGKLGHRVVRFEFPYMQRRRAEGRRFAPDRMPRLIQAWQDVVAEIGSDRLIIGGKSMGGRIASHLVLKRPTSGLVCLGYPFHPPGKPDQLRVENLLGLRTPTLILQGERDAFGHVGEVASYGLPSAIDIQWLPDGDHSFVPRKRSGLTREQNWDAAVEHLARFVRRVNSPSL